MKAMILILTTLLLLACENAPVRRQDLVAKHPEWDSKLVALIQNGYLGKGMTQEQVRAAWGAPCEKCTGTVTAEWGSAWEYPTQVVFFDTEGKVTRWTAK